MPTYLFKCDYCNKEFDVKLEIAEVDKKKLECLECGKDLKRVYSFSTRACGKAGGSRPFCATGKCPFAKGGS